ncbi:MAG: hypothetical protein HQL32_05640 [Planctomycetes bacterium]|nr:hypothetical protein [Planctomycetota bacterium]
MSLRILFIILALLLIEGTLWSNGLLKKISIYEEVGKSAIVLQMEIAPRTSEEFDQYAKKIKNSHLFLDPENESDDLILYFDKVANGLSDFDFVKKTDLIKAFYVDEIKGSRLKRDKIANADGREFKTVKMTFKGKANLLFAEVTREQKTGENLMVRFQLSLYDKKKDKGEMLLEDGYGKYLTLNSYESEPYFSHLVGGNKMKDRRAQLLQEIKQYKNSDYVTAIHNLMNISSSDAVKMVQGQLSPDGKITAISGTDQLVITDRKEYVLNIIQILENVDVQAPEVLIEVKVIELQRGHQKELGLNWSGSSRKSKFNVSGSMDTTSVLPAPINGRGVTGTVVEALARNELEALTLRVSAMIEDGKARVMAEPRLMVANKMTGEFKLTEKRPYFIRKSISFAENNSQSSGSDSQDSSKDSQTKVLTDSVTEYTKDGYAPSQREDSNTVNSTVDTQGSNNDKISKSNATFSSSTSKNQSYGEVLFESGIQLRVTPQIRQSGVIELELNPIITDLNDALTGTDSPGISLREIKTTAYLKDGDTLALGGLIYEKTTGSEVGVPLLSKIPGLGRLFKNKKRSSTKVELLFLVKTRIVQL